MDGDSVSYAITHGNDAGKLAINATSGALSVAGSLAGGSASVYELTVAASDASGGMSSVGVTVKLIGPDCGNGTVIPNPESNQALVADCRVLSAAKALLEGASGDALDWSAATAITQREGVTTGGTPSRVTGLDLSSKKLAGTIPAALGTLTALTTLDLSSNKLAGTIPAELGSLARLSTLGLSGNQFSGCVPTALRSLGTAIDGRSGSQDLAQLSLPYCDATAPAPTSLSASSPTETGVTLTWVGAANDVTPTYRVDYRVSGSNAEWLIDAFDLSAVTHEVDGLVCGTSYEFRVSAFGDGTSTVLAWGEPSTSLTTDTSACTPPTFGAESYTFTVRERAAIGAVVGTVSATDADPVTYAITAGNEAGTFAINETSGSITLAAALDYDTTSRYALTVSATDAAGGAAAVPVTITVTEFDGEYDADDDGLIEVRSLAQLHAIRWDLDGDGTSTHPRFALAFNDALTGMGCPTTGCVGYELIADLDFDTNGNGAVDVADAYWNDGAGWVPIGTGHPGFTATFEGNGHTIANLRIARASTNDVGLFGRIGTGSVIRNVGLRAVDVAGREDTGSLVGENYRGRIQASYATGAVAARGSNSGGLVGRNSGTIETSYARVAVAGVRFTGGLVGENAGTIQASYATGAVRGTDDVGGLAGRIGGSVTASYSTGTVTGNSRVGGLVGDRTSRVTAGYWDTATSGQSRSGGGVAKTTSELQTPTAYAGIYADWNLDLDGETGGENPWHFGTTSQYPALQVDFDGDGTASWAEFGEQRPAPDASRVDYDADDDGLIEVANLAQLNAIRWDPDGNGFATDPGYAAAFPRAPPGMGCATNCTGYELTADLDFDTNGNGLVDLNEAYWNDGAGWEPIGASRPRFAATFEGNGHVIANLRIARASTNDVGLFGFVDRIGVVRNVGLVGIDVRGNSDVGGLVGENAGTIQASYATGAVVAGGANSGGLAGRSYGTIQTSYARVAVTGTDDVGGLVGENAGAIQASYATGAVGGTRNVGGLVGEKTGSGTISASYATGAVTGDHGTGGLIGTNTSAITASYWDTATSGQSRIGGGEGKTTSELQTPTGYSGIYAAWNVDLDGETGGEDPWQFGTTSQYPALQVDFNGDGTVSWTEFGDQRPAPNTAQVDYDADDDGLIEVGNLAQLHAIRWDLDGNGFATEAGYAAAFPRAPPGMGCATGCTGYELIADLDFDTNGNGVVDVADAYWNDGAGWVPIGTGPPGFTATFEGNGHTIAKLRIVRASTDEVGLFGRIGRESVIRRVGLRAVDVTGRDETGALVGENDRGTIQASYVTGRVAGRTRVGGMVGKIHQGAISASYAASAVTGSDWDIGGLVGRNDRGTISASYATGAVTNQHRVAGLVGMNSGGTITASYATGVVRGERNLGGLVGESSGTITASYWDTATSGQSRSRGGVGQTTSALQTPTGYSGIYAAWNVDLDGETGGDDPWQFGTTSQYPALQVDFNGDGTVSWTEFGDQRPAPNTAQVDYDADDDGLIEVGNLAQLHAIRWDLDGNGFATEAGYAAAFPRAPPGMGCATGCTGYELIADLDFDTNGNGVVDVADAYWNDGAGWVPIGTGPPGFTATFEGNGHTIAKLRIVRASTDEVGLFGRIGRESVIRRVGLRAVDVTGRPMSGGWWGRTWALSGPATRRARWRREGSTAAGWWGGTPARSRRAMPGSP